MAKKSHWLMRVGLVLGGLCLAGIATPAMACQTMTPEGVKREQHAEVRGVVTVTGPGRAVLVPELVRFGAHRKSYEITWTPPEENGLSDFMIRCNEWFPKAPRVRGIFHLKRRAPGRGPFVVLAAKVDEQP